MSRRAIEDLLQECLTGYENGLAPEECLAPFADRPPRSAPGQQMIARTVRLADGQDDVADAPDPLGDGPDGAPTRRIDVT